MSTDRLPCRAAFETGRPNDDRRTLEVLTTHGGARELDRLGIPWKPARRGPAWPDPAKGLTRGAAVHVWQRARGSDAADPLEVAFRREAARVRAQRSETQP